MLHYAPSASGCFIAPNIHQLLVSEITKYMQKNIFNISNLFSLY